MDFLDFFEFFCGESGEFGVVMGRVDVFSFAEEDAVNGLEALEERVDATYSWDDYGDGSVVDDKV